MKDIALAGLVLTAEEWEALDPSSRGELMAAVTRRDDRWVISTAAEPEPEPTAA
jgi:hypothetical protein